MSNAAPNPAYLKLRWRSVFVVMLFVIAGAVMAVRAVHLQVFDSGFLVRQADARHLRIAPIAAHRGTITDRNGEPLAVSTPVDSIWAEPSELAKAQDRLTELGQAVGREPAWILRRITSNMDREFVYLRRHMRPADAAAVLALGLPGVASQREYRRYYPAGEVAGHVLGFTDIDDSGQEGLELAYESHLRGESGSKRIVQDNLGRPIKDVESIRAPRHGRTLVASLDLGMQYIAYRELKTAVKRHDALSGSIVVLDVRTGEVLAMANQPSYNPNDRSQFSGSRYRNRTVTDIFEPGSAIKPLVVAAALESGRYSPRSLIDTSPGYLTVGAKTIEDKHNLGRIDLTTVLAKSSNVGASKIALNLEPEQLWTVLSRFGLGQLTTSGFPGESSGLLNNFVHWRTISQATLAYGYGLSVTPLQLTHAYAAIGAGGLSFPVSFVRADAPMTPTRTLSTQTSTELMTMMEAVVTPEGTGRLAAVPGYSVAGKTGTSWKFHAGGYSKDRYTAVFAGLVPASRPRFAIVVVVDEPRGDEYYGGDVAAPVFAAVAAGALRINAVPPDALDRLPSGSIVQARAPVDAVVKP